MRRAWRGVCAVEVGFEEDIRALDRIDAQQLECASHALGPVRGLYKNDCPDPVVTGHTSGWGGLRCGRLRSGRFNGGRDPRRFTRRRLRVGCGRSRGRSRGGSRSSGGCRGSRRCGGRLCGLRRQWRYPSTRGPYAAARGQSRCAAQQCCAAQEFSTIHACSSGDCSSHVSPQERSPQHLSCYGIIQDLSRCRRRPNHCWAAATGRARASGCS